MILPFDRKKAPLLSQVIDERDAKDDARIWFKAISIAAGIVLSPHIPKKTRIDFAAEMRDLISAIPDTMIQRIMREWTKGKLVMSFSVNGGAKTELDPESAMSLLEEICYAELSKRLLGDGWDLKIHDDGVEIIRQIPK